MIFGGEFVYGIGVWSGLLLVRRVYSGRLFVRFIFIKNELY